MKTVKYKNYTVTRFDSGTIEATKDGHIVSPTKPLLRELAKELNVNIENENGNLHITRQLGVLIIRAIENKTTQSYDQSDTRNEIIKTCKTDDNTIYPIYELMLHKTYYDQGFFNLGIAVDKYIRSDNGPITILLGDSKLELTGRVDRNANLNCTPRIFSTNALKEWIKKNFQLKDLVMVHIISPNKIWLKKDK